ncbi:MAG: hypothetical protein WC878_04315 [Candidatus Paceibacterota bacterium]
MLFFNRKNKERKAIVKNARALLCEIFGLTPDQYQQQNEVWSRWLDSYSGSRDLDNLLTSDAGDAYKARAIAILLAPSDNHVPFECREKNYLTYDDVSKILVTIGENNKLKEFLHRLIELNLETVAKLNDNYRSKKVKSIYNRYIVNVLESLGDTDLVASRRLFSLFKYSAHDTDCDGEKQTEYFGPLAVLLSSRAPEMFKFISDTEARKSLVNNEGNDVREDWGRSYREYRENIRQYLYDETLPFSAELFSEQIKFLIENQPKHIRRTGLGWFWMSKDLFHTVRFLDGETYATVRREFVEHMLFHNGKEDDLSYFHIYSKEDYEVAEYLLGLFTDDAHIADFLRLQMKSYLERSVKEREEAKVLEAEKLAVLEAMK